MTDTPKITEAEIARLRELAEAATAQTTGNPWLPDTGGIVLDPDRPGNGWDGTIVCEVPSTERPERRRAIRDYLVELDPQTVIALLDAVKAQTEPPADDVDDAAREALDRAIGSVLFNASNFPEVVQARLLGQDMLPLRMRLVLAILDAVTVSPKKGQD